jgi:hypothetical protein
MKKLNYLLLIFVLIVQGCNSQTTPKKEIYNKAFNWRITIPENFESVKPEDWEKMQNKGMDALEDTYGERIVNQSKSIFVFKSDQLNYFESNYQPFDTAIDGDYLESCKGVNDILITTFKDQMPDVIIEKSNSIEKIDNLDFIVFKIKIEYPNKMVLHSLMYSRLFGKKDLSVNIMYVDPSKGALLLNSWKKSTFNK